MHTWDTLTVNLCPKEDASPSIHFGEHLSRFWLVLRAAGVCWDSESHYSSSGNESPFRRDVGKDGKKEVTAVCRETRGWQWEIRSWCPGFESHKLSLKCSYWKERQEGAGSVSCSAGPGSVAWTSRQFLVFGFGGHFGAAVTTLPWWHGALFSITACLVHRRVQGPIAVWPRHSSACLLRALTYFVVIATVIHRLQ